MDPKVPFSEVEAYFRAANYISLVQLYLTDNVLLKYELSHEQVKKVILGHWGSVPGINFIYAHANKIVREKKIRLLPLVGTGHSAAAVVANLYIEGTLQLHYSKASHSTEGLRELANLFAAPDGIPTELSPLLPGCIHPGGELGHALGVAFGTILDDPSLITLCVIGDGEIETGSTATAWQSIRFVSSQYSGAVLPIVNLNGFRMTSPSVLGMMKDEEVIAYFKGLGYTPKLVTGQHFEMHDALIWAVECIQQRRIDSNTLNHDVIFPLIILKTPKGWTGPEIFRGELIAGRHRAHKAPITDAHSKTDALNALQTWLLSYKPYELFDDEGRLTQSVLKNLPDEEFMLGNTAIRTFKKNYRPIRVPHVEKYAIVVDNPGDTYKKAAEEFAEFISGCFDANKDIPNFRLFSPDELTSNRLGILQKRFGRSFGNLELDPERYFAYDGLILEVLSEQLCQAWLQGYVATGRHGIFASYECFIPIVTSMLSQYIKFLKELTDLKNYIKYPSINYFITSLGWGNNYSHQNVDFYQTLVGKYGSFVRIYFPPDVNTLLVCTKECLTSHNRVNVIAAAKSSLPQWISIDAAHLLVQNGAQICTWISDAQKPDLIFAGIGDYATREAIEAIWLLKSCIPNLSLRYVSICEITCLGASEQFQSALDDHKFVELFDIETDVLIIFGGYPATIKSLLFDRVNPHRFTIFGYRDQGTTTTDVEMHIRNSSSRYHLVLKALDILKKQDRLHSSDNSSIQQLIDNCHNSVS